MSKYDPLRHHLANQRADEWWATFTEIENVLGAKLPPSARRYAEWWANNPAEEGRQCQAWLKAGWRTSDVDVAAMKVRFTRKQ